MGASIGTVSEVRAPSRQEFLLPMRLFLFFCIAVAAFLAVLPVLYISLHFWITDPLRSVGLMLPVMAAALLVRDLRYFSGPWNGNLYGAVVAAAGVAVLLLHETYRFRLYLTHSIQIDPLPGGLGISFLLAGALLLTGGRNLLRACLFPVVLFGITNPVPHFFSDHFDLPLQVASATAARGFAHLIGEYPSGEQLRLMFTPNFGMFIAPGCNGIRGAITLGYLSLFAAAWRRMRPTTCALFFACGVLVGYGFNFLRLFFLVLYYKAGQWWPSIQPYGTQVDYAIGGMLFLLASFVLGTIVFRRKPAHSVQRHSETPAESRKQEWFSRGWQLRYAVFLFLCLIPACLNVRTIVRNHRQSRLPEIAADQLPTQVGAFHLVRQWYEYSDGIRVYHWGSYSNGAPADDVSLGLWLPPHEHDVRYSHATRGDILQTDEPVFHTIPRLGEVSYNTYSYDEPDASVFLAALECRPCLGRIPGFEHTLGPLRIISTEATKYFEVPPPLSAVLTHKGPPGTPEAKLRVPVQQFVDGLDESSLFHPEASAR